MVRNETTSGGGGGTQPLTKGSVGWLVKGRVYCFSMQVVINKCFLLNPKKKFVFSPKS